MVCALGSPGLAPGDDRHDADRREACLARPSRLVARLHLLAGDGEAFVHLRAHFALADLHARAGEVLDHLAHDIAFAAGAQFGADDGADVVVHAFQPHLVRRPLAQHAGGARLSPELKLLIGSVLPLEAFLAVLECGHVHSTATSGTGSYPGPAGPAISTGASLRRYRGSGCSRSPAARRRCG